MHVEDLESFKKAIDNLGFEKFWSAFIKTYFAETRPDLRHEPDKSVSISFSNSIFNFDNIGELYEIALEHINRQSKKEHGQYYTPKDVCRFMAQKTIALRNQGQNLADVCCGTGNLAIEVLSLLPRDQAVEILKCGKLYLYDIDPVAMKLAIMKICIMFVPNGDTDSLDLILSKINSKIGNFLSEENYLPKNCIVISNPPYAKLPKDLNIWSGSKTKSTNDLYSVFMEKIAIQSEGAVVISPQSFLGGNKFKSLREVLSSFGGSIWSFDNVPACIFCGRKKGIFNTNTANSVRAAITVIDKNESGFRVSPMIRFRTDERKKMFSLLDALLGDIHYSGSQEWTKVPKSLEKMVIELKKAKFTVKDLVTELPIEQKEEYKITIPSTPRYFVTGSKRNLGRSSKIEIYAKDKESFDRLYLIINSTFSYLWWRIYDGGITLSKSTLMTMPVPDLPLNRITDLVNEGIGMENRCMVNKINAGKINENIKFPEEYRSKVNHVILHALNFDNLDANLASIHCNNITNAAPLWI